MKLHVSRLLPALLVALTALPVVAQKEFDYRRYFAKPTTAEEFWEAIQFEREVGRHDLAAEHLKAFLAKNPTPDDLVKLQEKFGISPFLDLRRTPEWNRNREKDKEARDGVESLIDKMTQAVRAKRADPVRIKFYIGNLYAGPDENAFARVELIKSGAPAVPYILEELLNRPQSERGPILDALRQMGADTVRPLLAALDIANDSLRADIIDVIRRRRDFLLLKGMGNDPAPYLWPLASKANPSALVRTKAQESLTVLLELKNPDQLPAAYEVLTAEAERYYYHQVRFPDPRKVSIWRWDGKKLLDDTNFTASTAEEYYCLRFARQALDINPRYEPAQIVLLSLVLDHGFAVDKPDRPMGSLKPKVRELLSTINPEVIVATLERAMRDERTAVVLASVQALGNLADVRALQPDTKGEPALVRALHYGDRRVQMAAVESILKIPGAASLQAASRLVEILQQYLTPEEKVSARRRIVVAMADDKLRRDVGRAVDQLGAEALVYGTGREAMRRLTVQADVDAVLVDPTLPDGFPFLLAQLRADRTLRRLPVIVAAIPGSDEARELFDRLRKAQVTLDLVNREMAPLLEEERRRVERLGPIEAKRLVRDPVLESLSNRKKDLEQQLQLVAGRFEDESQRQEEKLRRQIAQYRNVWVEPLHRFIDYRFLRGSLDERFQESGTLPLTKEEKTEFTETALRLLARMARGEVKGFDVRPAVDAVIETLRTTTLSPEATVAGIEILERQAGPKPRQALMTLLLDGSKKLPPAVRVAAADGLLRNIQQFGPPTGADDVALRDGIRRAMNEEKLDANVKDRLDRLLGGLRPDTRNTGEKLKGFVP